MPTPTTSPPEPTTEPLSVVAALASLPVLFRANYHTTSVPGQLLTQYSFHWWIRLVVSLAVLVGSPFLLASLVSREETVTAVLLGILALMFVIIFNVRTELLIDITTRTVSRRQSSLGVLPFGTRTWNVRPDMEIKAFTYYDDNGRPGTHQLALVDGRHRLPLTPPDHTSVDESLETIKLGNALAQLLGVPFTGYAKWWRFYWP